MAASAHLRDAGRRPCYALRRGAHGPVARWTRLDGGHVSTTERDLAERVTTLEIRFSHVERLVQELSDVVYRQQRELDELARRERQLTDKLSAQDPGLVDASTPERPPHY